MQESRLSDPKALPAGTQLAERQMLTRNNGAEPATLDPQLAEGTPEANLTRDLFEGLVIQDAKGNIIPGVAEHWTVLDGGKTYRFDLRGDARWSNNQPVTAQDFVYSWRRAVDPATASPYAWYLESASILNAGPISRGEMPPDLLGVKALDNLTLEVKLNTAIPYFLRMLPHATLMPVPRDVIKHWGNDWTQPSHMVSNGAFRLMSWTVNERIILGRNPYYWDNAHTHLNEVQYLPVSSENAALARYKAGEIDLGVGAIPIEHFKSLKRETPDQVHITGRIATYFYEFNTRHPPLNDARVRQALNLAINRRIISDRVLGQGQIPAYTLTPNNIAGFTPHKPAWAAMPYERRVDEARKLLQEAGISAEKPLSLKLLYNTGDNHKKIALAVASMWKKELGVQTELVNEEWKSFLESTRHGDFDVARAGWIGDYNEASSMLGLLTSTHGANHSGYHNPAYDALLEHAQREAEPTVRNSFYQKAENLIARDAPIAPLYQYVTARLVKPWVGGYADENPEDMIYSKDLYILAH
ncbi:ABC transporter substrate-binding protein [Pokkaliibacter sp. CJK22405]|uniref:ABC transporter substrate-binding protein n=1 Tax=Pokkaliibacter sp. CJK22405 TaxID=3384615 RepID=UPI00398503A0